MSSPVKRLLPFLAWFEGLRLRDVRADLIAGLTVALVLIPQSMAYAQLAGLPAYYGLYAAFLPPMVASLFGSSRQLATGPVAVVSLMTAAALEPLATAGSMEYIQYAIALALLVGLFQLLLGILRLGIVVNLLSHPVVNGFTCAAALIIATSQLSKIFGVAVDKAPHHYETVYRVVVAALHETHWPTLAMAILAFVLMAGLRRINPKIPGVLVAVVITTLIAWTTGFEHKATIPLSAVRDPEVVAAVESFNELVQERREVAELRLQSHRSLRELGDETDLCTQCHEDLGGVSVLKDSSHRRGGTSSMAAIIHQKAGLLDDLSHRLEEREEEARATLRRYRLTASVDEAGETTYSRTEGGGTSDAGGRRIWRILVGNGPLVDPHTGEAGLRLTSGGAVVGAIPPGLPSLEAPRGNLETILGLIPTAIIITVLGFMEAISIAKAMAVRTRQKLDPNQELIGQGLANIVGSFGHSYACSGSFSRSAVNLRAGAVTGLSNVFASGIVVVVLLFFTPLLYHLPQAVLAAIIMMAVIGLLNVQGFVHAWQTHRFDGITGLVSFAGTLAFAPHLEWGIFLGVGLSLLGYIHRTMYSPVVALSVDEHGILRDAKRNNLPLCEHLALLRFDGPLNFVTAGFLQGRILEAVGTRPRLRHILIAAHAVNDVDSSGVEMLRDIIDRLRGTGLEFSMSGIKDDMIDVFRRSHLTEVIGADHLYETQAQAIAAVYPSSHEHQTEETCPFHSVMPRTTELALHPDGSLRDAKRHGLRLCQHIAVIRFDDAVNYANASFLEQAVAAMLDKRPGVRHVVFSAHAIGDIDVQGARRLGELVARLRESGHTVCFSGFKDHVIDVLHETGVFELIGKQNMFPTQLYAIAHLHAPAHAGQEEEDCPFAELMPHWTELSLHPDGKVRSAERYALATCSHVLVVRLDGIVPLMDFTQLAASLQDMLRHRPTTRHVVLDAHTLGGISEGGAHKLIASLKEMSADGYSLVLADLPDDLTAVLEQEAWQTGLTEDSIFPSAGMAVAWVFDEAHAGRDEADCPLLGLLPTATEVSLHPDGAYRSAARHGLRLCSRIIAIRFDGPLDFARSRHLEREFFRCLEARSEARYVLVIGNGISSIDIRAARRLGVLIEKGRAAGYRCYLSGLKDEVLDVLRKTGTAAALGEDSIFPVANRAILAIHAEAHRGSDEEHCPLLEPLASPTADGDEPAA